MPTYLLYLNSFINGTQGFTINELDEKKLKASIIELLNEYRMLENKYNQLIGEITILEKLIFKDEGE